MNVNLIPKEHQIFFSNAPGIYSIPENLIEFKKLLNSNEESNLWIVSDPIKRAVVIKNIIDFSNDLELVERIAEVFRNNLSLLINIAPNFICPCISKRKSF